MILKDRESEGNINSQIPSPLTATPIIPNNTTNNTTLNTTNDEQKGYGMRRGGGNEKAISKRFDPLNMRSSAPTIHQKLKQKKGLFVQNRAW